MVAPINPAALGLSTLGFDGQNSESNSVGDQQGPVILDELLSTTRKLQSPEARVAALEQAQAQLAAQETPGGLDALLSKRGLIPGGLALAALIGGNPGMAAGIGLGALQKSQLLAKEAAAEKQQQQIQLQEQHEKALDRLDKSLQRNTTLLTTRPEAFIDPATGRQTIDPVSLGVLTTGREIPLSAVAQAQRNKWSESQDQMYKFFMDRLGSATTDQDRRTIIRGIEELQGWEFPEELRVAVSREVGSNDYLQNIAESVIKDVFLDPRTGDTGFAAFTAARDAGQLDQPWNFLPMVQWTTDEDKVDINQEVWGFIDEMNQWWNDPNVPMSEKLETGGDVVAIAERVFEDRPGSLALLQDKVSSTNPWITGEDVVSTYFRLNGNLNQMDEVLSLRDMAGARTPEERQALLQRRTTNTLGQMDTLRRQTAVSGAREAIASGATRLAQAFDNQHSAGTYIDWANAAVQRATQILEKEGLDPTPENFSAAYNRAIEALVITERQRMNENANAGSQ